MPAGKPAVSNTVWLPVVIFVVLFLITMVFAFLFYVKAQDYIELNGQLKRDIEKLASEQEQRTLAKIVGRQKKQETGRGKMSYLGTMNDHLDYMISAIMGELPLNATAETKVNMVVEEINKTIKNLGEDASAMFGPDDIDLLHEINSLKQKTDAANQRAQDMEDQKNGILDDFDLRLKAWAQEAKDLTEQRDHYQKENDRVQQTYNDLKSEMQESADDRVKTYMNRANRAKQQLKEMSQQLSDTQKELKITGNQLNDALQERLEIKPKPGIDVLAFEPDAAIVDIEIASGLVYLDIGSDDHVYRGLTFAVYDLNMPIPADGKGKAEIEVFRLTEKASVARINTLSKTNPIVKSDIVANLIWNAKTSNKFLVAGDFDFDGDGKIDRNGKEKIGHLVERWGATLIDEVAIDTDFVVLGDQPAAMKKPTREQTDIDPMIEDRYLMSLESVRQYHEALTTANKLSVPIFNQQRFMHLIGYKSLASKTSPF